jgi:hypothetical protein
MFASWQQNALDWFLVTLIKTEFHKVGSALPIPVTFYKLRQSQLFVITFICQLVLTMVFLTLADVTATFEDNVLQLECFLLNLLIQQLIVKVTVLLQH